MQGDLRDGPRTYWDLQNYTGTMWRRTSIMLLWLLGSSTYAVADWSPVVASGGVYIDSSSMVELLPETWAVRYRIDRADRMRVTGRAVVACRDGKHRLAGGTVTEPSGVAHEFDGSPDWKTVTSTRTAGNDIHRFVCALGPSIRQ